MKKTLILVHRWVSLSLLAFWIIQAATGALITFHWEMVDASIAGPHRDTDLDKLEAAIGKIGASRAPAKTLWVTAGADDRYKVTLRDGQKLIFAGDGTVLSDTNGPMASVFSTLVGLHHDLLGEETGAWIVGLSGIVLFLNLLGGLYLAWPRRGTWRRSITPGSTSNPVARPYSFHRAIGLWGVIPGLVLVASGVMMRFEDTTALLVGALGPQSQHIAGLAQARGKTGLAGAVRTAQATIPGSRLTAVTFPTDQDATYRVRLLEPGEIRRAYGKSSVTIAAATGAVIAVERASELGESKSFVNALFPVHTGEAGGIVGRLLVVATGAWLVTMIALGVWLYAARRRARRRKR